MKAFLMPWGKYSGIDIQDEEIPTHYLKWLVDQPWMGAPHNSRLKSAVEDEIIARGSE